MPNPIDDPPDELPQIRTSEYRRISTRRVLWRVYSTVDHPIPWNGLRRWGPTSSRWEPHPSGPPREHPDRAARYAATSIPTALAEVFQHHRTIICDSGIRLVGYRFTRPVRLLDANSTWLTRAGASQTIAYGDTRRAQRWAAAIADAHPALDGIAQESRLDPAETNVALWLPAAGALDSARSLLNRSLADPELRAAITAAADKLGYDVDDGTP